MDTRNSVLRLVTLVTGLLGGTMCARAGAQTPGITYRMHVTASGGHAVRPDTVASTGWTGVVVWGAGRGRLDIVDGRQAGVFEKGDYVLFDSTDYITVHPATRSFYASTAGIATAALKGMAESGVAVKVGNARTSLDTLGASDVIDGHATQRYRMNVGYTITTDASAFLADMDPDDIPPDVAAELAPSSEEITTTSELWLARLPELPQPPFGGVARGARELTGDLAKQVAAVKAALPTGTVALRSVITTSRSHKPTGPADAAASNATVLRTDIGEIQTRDVDLAQLVLPTGFVEAVRPALAALYPDGLPSSLDHGAKWRSKPTP